MQYPLMKPPEVCELLDIRPRTLRTLVETRQLPVIKVGRLNRFDRDAIEAWMRANTRKALAS